MQDLVTISPKSRQQSRERLRSLARVLGVSCISLWCIACPSKKDLTESSCGDAALGAASCEAAACGDGIVLGAEECDDGEYNGAGYGWCAANCSFGPFCGDGVVDDLEECDDGNTESADGCDAGCQVEVGFVCVAGRCAPSCGEGWVGEAACEAFD